MSEPADNAHAPTPDPLSEAGAHPFVGRGGLKLAHALREFSIDVRGKVCADFGCNVGGFTDCLLQAGASCVYAVDTGYGMLAWRIRQDPRVVVMERTNALHVEPPESGVAVIAVDLGWTRQRHAIPAALRWLREDGVIVTLIKPHYEAEGKERRVMRRGVLDEERAAEVADRVVREMPSLGARVLGVARSPVIGGSGKKSREGNVEWLAAVVRDRG